MYGFSNGKLILASASEYNGYCDPFACNFPALNVFFNAMVGFFLPFICPCKYPCSVERVRRFVRFYYVKRYKFDTKLHSLHSKVFFLFIFCCCLRNGKYYRTLNMNSDTDKQIINEEIPISFIVHGYTDSVKFNQSGLSVFFS